MKMVKVKTAELVGAQLDWAVALADGRAGSDDDEEAVPGKLYWCPSSSPAKGYAPAQHVGPSQINPETGWHFGRYSPSTDWALAGPIIEREHLQMLFDADNPESERWGAINDRTGNCEQGSTPIIAACRTYVAMRLGDEVEVPALEGGQ
jgi:hypothetical protein